MLLQEEVNPVMSALLDNGIEVTALHNHFFWDDPHVYYMHVHGMGKAVDLAREVKLAFDLIGHVKPEAVAPLSGSGAALDTAKIAQIVGHTGEASGTVYKITVGRSDLAMKDHGAAINARMGLNTGCVLRHAGRCRGRRRYRHARGRSDFGIEDAAEEWHRCRGDSSPHDGRKTASDFSSLLGPWTGRQVGECVQGNARRVGQRHVISLSEEFMRTENLYGEERRWSRSLLSLCASGVFGQTLKEVTKFDLPGPGGKRFDYLTIDPDDHYLISAHLAADQTYVVDLRTNKVVATITDTPGAEGVEYVSELKKFYTSNAHDNTIGVVDLQQMKVVKKLKTEAKPDGSAYAAPFHKLYVSDERGKAEAVVDVTKDEIVKTLHFDSETGMPQYDPVARKVYVNLQDRDIFAVIDPATNNVVGRYPVAKCKGNHGMALDPEHHRAFLSCEGNELMTVFDLDKKTAIAFLPYRTDPMSSSSIRACGGSTSPATAGRLPSSTKTTPTTTGSSKTFASSTRCTRSRLT